MISVLRAIIWQKYVTGRTAKMCQHCAFIRTNLYRSHHYVVQQKAGTRSCIQSLFVQKVSNNLRRTGSPWKTLIFVLHVLSVMYLKLIILN